MSTNWDFLKGVKSVVNSNGATTASTIPGNGTSQASSFDKPTTIEGATLGFGVNTHGERVEYVDFEKYGVQQAGAARAQVQTLKAIIGLIYHEKVTDDADEQRRQEERQADLQGRIAEQEKHAKDALTRKERAEEEIEHIQAHIDTLEDQRNQIKAGNRNVLDELPSPDRLSFWIGVVILVFLTCYLYIFYVSAIYNTFLLDPTNKKAIKSAYTIFNGDAFAAAFSQPAGFVLVLTGPFMFLGLGYLIHKFNERRQYWRTAAVLFFTFLFDVVIAYQIVADVHAARYLRGAEEGPWQPNLIFYKGNFYTILLAGFLMYIIWGLVLSFVLEGYKQLQPIRFALKGLAMKIGKQRAKMREQQEIAKEASQKMTACDAEIKKLREQAKLRLFDRQKFERKVGALMHGWLTYIANAYARDEAQRRTDEAAQAKDQVVNAIYQDNLVDFSSSSSLA